MYKHEGFLCGCTEMTSLCPVASRYRSWKVSESLCSSFLTVSMTDCAAPDAYISKGGNNCEVRDHINQAEITLTEI